MLHGTDGGPTDARRTGRRYGASAGPTTKEAQAPRRRYTHQALLVLRPEGIAAADAAAKAKSRAHGSSRCFYAFALSFVVRGNRIFSFRGLPYRTHKP